MRWIKINVLKNGGFKIRHEHLSLKVQNVEFDISVPPGKMYLKNLTSKNCNEAL